MTSAAARPVRVLICDDNHDAADTLAALVRLLGYEVTVCYDGPSALRAVGGFRPDACLLDLMMPRMDGVELAGRLREATGPRPMLLVATTALGAVEDRTRTALAGFHYHLVKPVDSSTLLDALGRFGAALGRH